MSTTQTRGIIMERSQSLDLAALRQFLTQAEFMSIGGQSILARLTGQNAFFSRFFGAGRVDRQNHRFICLSPFVLNGMTPDNMTDADGKLLTLPLDTCIYFERVSIDGGPTTFWDTFLLKSGPSVPANDSTHHHTLLWTITDTQNFYSNGIGEYEMLF